MADCIKIAIDFVSPENIDRCEKLTKEFREQNQRKAWKEDVLQLRTMMWFAWQSCTQREAEMDDDDDDDEVLLVHKSLSTEHHTPGA
jgi:lysine-specific demethylase 3